MQGPANNKRGLTMWQFSLRHFLRFTAMVLDMLWILVPTSALASAACAGLTGCDKKACEIERQLAIAESKGNKHRVNGLRKALKKNQQYCTNQGLKKELSKDIKAAKQEV